MAKKQKKLESLPQELYFLLQHSFLGIAPDVLQEPKSVVKQMIEASIANLAYSHSPERNKLFIKLIPPLMKDNVLADIVSPEAIDHLSRYLFKTGQHRLFVDLFAAIAPFDHLADVINGEDIHHILKSIIKKGHGRKQKVSNILENCNTLPGLVKNTSIKCRKPQTTDGTVQTASKLLIALRFRLELMPEPKKLRYNRLMDQFFETGQIQSYTRLLDAFIEIFPSFIRLTHPYHTIFRAHTNETGLPKSLYVIFNNSKSAGMSVIYDAEHFGSLKSLRAAWQYDPQMMTGLNKVVDLLRELAQISSEKPSAPLRTAVRKELTAVGLPWRNVKVIDVVAERVSP